MLSSNISAVKNPGLVAFLSSSAFDKFITGSSHIAGIKILSPLPPVFTFI